MINWLYYVECNEMELKMEMSAGWLVGICMKKREVWTGNRRFLVEMRVEG